MPQLLAGVAFLSVTAAALAQDCISAGERAQNAPEWPEFPFKPCCAGGRLVEKTSTWGLFCPGGGEKPVESDEDCYKTSERAQSAPGWPVVEWKRCCSAGDVQEDVEGDWGKFCVTKDGLKPEAPDGGITIDVGTTLRIDTIPAPPVAGTPAAILTTKIPMDTTKPQALVTTRPKDITSPAPPVVVDKCEGLGSSVRKEVKSLTETEWANYVEAHRRLRENGVYAEFSAAHGTVSRHDEYFLIWHRLMLTEWNKELDAVFPGVVQPFFDWSQMPDNIFDDKIFGPNGRFGGEGQGSIPDGSFAGLAVSRRFDRDLSLTTATRIREVRDLPGFSDFSERTQMFHNTFHVIVGGDMLTFARAPNDFLFYMHHSFIDKMWKDWQLSGNSLKVSSTIDLDEMMLPWGKTAREVLDASDCTNYEGVSGSLAGSSVFAADDEFVFETKSDKIEAEKQAATKLKNAPEAVKKELKVELKREDDLRQACLEIGEDPARVDEGISGLRDVILKGESSLDLNDAEEVANSNAEEIVAIADEQLAILETGNLTPANSGTENVRNVKA